VNARALAGFLSLVSVGTNVLGQESSLPRPYTDKDAYQIYAQLIPNEETWGTKTKVIEEETVPGEGGMMDLDSCVAPPVALDFRDAIANFKTNNSRRWLLQRQFELSGPYELVSSDTIKATFRGGEQSRTEGAHPLDSGWKAFYARYPGSGGFIVLSAVGFNKDKTRAVVYSGASCGSLCGAWSFHLFKKVDGKWTEAPGIMCHSMS